MRSQASQRAGFSLTELMFVLSIISLLCALLLPVIDSARRKAHQTVCLSNLRQIGIALSIYAQDYDERYPHAKDPSDAYSDRWGSDPSFQVRVLKPMPLLSDALVPYIKNTALWQCPSDSGFDFLDDAADDAGNLLPMDARPTCFQKFGMSYFYQTELGLALASYPAVGYEPFPPYKEHGPAEISVVRDANGSWHGGVSRQEKRYSALMADSHIRSLTGQENQAQWFTFISGGKGY